ncbi:acireductone synthase [Luteimonas huabeiensis]|uniref:acireductone synthase n=1 Tax=Luteimonas huabeiensis TaxID=1244513 RepID=UPI0004BC6527|nr:acireductone synthase [Luteimonas huabeiensis]
MSTAADLPATVLTDIEGTTSSISFVKEVLFPYAREHLPAFVAAHGREPGVRRWLDQVAAETGADGDEAVVRTLQQWIDADRKHTALKALQGLIWEEGYRQGAYAAHVYPDAARALRAWHAAGRRIAVYSSGSVPAQKLFFGHSEAGDLRALVSAWFDTETGGKREAASYARIAQALGTAPGEIVFLSDVVEELDAARESGLRTVLLDRREDYPEPREGEAAHGHPRIERFDQLEPA